MESLPGKPCQTPYYSGGTAPLRASVQSRRSWDRLSFNFRAVSRITGAHLNYIEGEIWSLPAAVQIFSPGRAEQERLKVRSARRATTADKRFWRVKNVSSA